MRAYQLIFRYALLTFLSLTILNAVLTQGVAINTTGNPADTSAILDLTSTTSGLLLPRMSNAQMLAIPLPAKGLIVYDNGNDRIMVNQGTTGTPNWQPVNSIWMNNGNGNTNATSHFLGTTDNQKLVFRTNNIFSGFLDPLDGNVSFGFRSGIGYEKDIAVGTYAMHDYALGENNIAIGDSALSNGMFFDDQIAIGAGAATRSQVADPNIFIGTGAGSQSTQGEWNTVLGAGALYQSSESYRNIAVGRLALAGTTGEHEGNLALGALANYAPGNGYSWRSTFIGCRAGISAEYLSTSLFIGLEAGKESTSCYGNIGVGAGVLGGGVMDGENTGNSNIAFGSDAMRSNRTGESNICFGNDALGINETGRLNIALGYHSSWHNGDGDFNVTIGHNAFDGNYEDTPDKNVAIGDSCLHDIEDGQGENTAVGSLSGYAFLEGEHNCLFGSQASSLINYGSYIVSIGHQTLRETIDANANTAIGQQAGDAFDFGNNNTLAGSFTDASADGFIASTALGYNTAITASDQVRIGWIFTASIGGYTNWSNLSDGRFKHHVQRNVPGLDFILRLKPVSYLVDLVALSEPMMFEKPIDSSENTSVKMRRSGFLAQEVVVAADSAGYDFSGIDAPKNPEDFYALRYEEFVVPLVQAVQEQQAEIEALKTSSLEILQRLNALRADQKQSGTGTFTLQQPKK